MFDLRWRYDNEAMIPFEAAPFLGSQTKDVSFGLGTDLIDSFGGEGKYFIGPLHVFEQMIFVFGESGKGESRARGKDGSQERKSDAEGGQERHHSDIKWHNWVDLSVR